MMANEEEFFSFIAANINADSNALRLKYHGKAMPFDVDFAITQIEGRKKAAGKIPTLLGNRNFLFPSALLAEQCTHEAIARYHATMIPDGAKLLDLTAGLCVDAYYMSQRSQVTAIEIDPVTAAVDADNMRRLCANVQVINNDCCTYVEQCTERFDAIFADPARRNHSTGRRVFSFAESSPNIVALLPHLREIAPMLYIKASPMVDITASLHELTAVEHVWVIDVAGECKELLFKVNLDMLGTEPDTKITAVELNATGNVVAEFSFLHPAPAIDIDTDSDIAMGDYLYEPYACILKAGGTDAIAIETGMNKLHRNSQLLYSHTPIENFPGRGFTVLSVLDFNDRNLRSLAAAHTHLNISTRNCRLTADQLKKRMKINDGGDRYLFATTDSHNHQLLLLCSK